MNSLEKANNQYELELAADLNSVYAETLIDICKQEKDKNSVEIIHFEWTKGLADWNFSKKLLAPLFFLAFGVFQVLFFVFNDVASLYNILSFLFLNVVPSIASIRSYVGLAKMDYTKLGQKKRPEYANRLIEDADLSLKIHGETSRDGTKLQLFYKDRILRSFCFSKDQEIESHQTLVEWQSELDDFKVCLQQEVDEKALEEKFLDDEIWKSKQSLTNTALQSPSSSLVSITSQQIQTKAKTPLPEKIKNFQFLSGFAVFLLFGGLLISNLGMVADNRAYAVNHSVSKDIVASIKDYKQDKGVYPTNKQLSSILKDQNLEDVGEKPSGESNFLYVEGTKGNYTIKMSQSDFLGTTTLKINKNKVVESYYAKFNNPADKVYSLDKK